jgi:hypothetical protein
MDHSETPGLHSLSAMGEQRLHTLSITSGISSSLLPNIALTCFICREGRCKGTDLPDKESIAANDWTLKELIRWRAMTDTHCDMGVLLKICHRRVE